MIADGVRPAATEADHLMEEALYYDSIAQTYGWTPEQTDAQPYELLQRMLAVAAIRNEISERKMRESG